MSMRDMMTYTGKDFDFWAPDPRSICIEDIAHQLACMNRYRGCTRVPYSVAEHSVRMSYLPIGRPIINLLHDTAEAYIGDVCSPQKRGLGWILDRMTLPDPLESGTRSFKSGEYIILKAIGKALRVEGLEHLAESPEVKEADRTIAVAEVRDLMPEGALEHPVFVAWFGGVSGSVQHINPWPWDVAKAEFLARYKELTHG